VDPGKRRGGPEATSSDDQAAARPLDKSSLAKTDVADWKRLAYAAIETLAASGQIFSVDDVFDLAGRPPNPYSVSAVLPTAVKRGLIVRAGAIVARDGRARLAWIGAS
jgi:hypothetical protein